MTKILIADDEQMEREALRRILEKGIEQVDEIALAVNGREAIELAARHRPDLILMDILMPGISGLEAVKQIRTIHPQAKIIIVSALDNFDYARQALTLGAVDYLLKPSTTEDIVSTVQKAVNLIQAEKSELERRMHEHHRLQKLLPVVEADLVAQLLFDQVYETHFGEMIDLLGTDLASSPFVMVLFVKQEESREMNSLDRNQLYAAVKELVHRRAQGWVGAMSGTQIPAVIFPDQERTMRSLASSLVREILNAGHVFPAAEFFIGVGGPCASLDEVKRSYHEALLASIDLSLPSKHQFYEDMRFHTLQADRAGFELEKNVIDKVRQGDWPAVRQMLIQRIERDEKTDFSVAESQQELLEVMLVIARWLQDLGITIEKPLFSGQTTNYRQLRAELSGIIDKLSKVTDRMRSEIEPDTVTRIKQYIVNHADRDMTLEAIADQFHLNPYYISKIFKEQAGVNYIDFLTGCRIEHAKDLLSDASLSLKEITFSVGYNDPNYFSRVFKKMCGYSPSEYRKIILKK